MATLYAASDGVIVRWLASADLEAQWPTAPAGATNVLTFDESTNAALVADLTLAQTHYRLLNGALSKDGAAVVVAAAGVAWSQRQQVYQQAQQVISDMTTFLALSNPTAAQTIPQVQENTRVLRWLVRHIVLGQ